MVKVTKEPINATNIQQIIWHFQQIVSLKIGSYIGNIPQWSEVQNCRFTVSKSVNQFIQNIISFFQVREYLNFKLNSKFPFVGFVECSGLNPVIEIICNYLIDDLLDDSVFLRFLSIQQCYKQPPSLEFHLPTYALYSAHHKIEYFLFRFFFLIRIKESLLQSSEFQYSGRLCSRLCTWLSIKLRKRFLILFF